MKLSFKKSLKLFLIFLLVLLIFVAIASGVFLSNNEYKVQYLNSYEQGEPLAQAASGVVQTITGISKSVLDLSTISTSEELTTLSTYQKADITFDKNLDNYQVEAPSFVTTKDNKLVFQPSKYDAGRYEINLHHKLFPNIQFNHNLKVEQKPVDFGALEAEIIKTLGVNKNRYGVYVHDLMRDKIIQFNGQETLPPASISKVPTAVLVLMDIDKGTLKYDDTYPIKKENKFYTHNKLYYYPDGTEVTLKEYLTKSIIDSDTTATISLEQVLGGYETVNKRTVEDLGVEKFFRKPHESTVESIGKVFAGIYKGQYLSPEKNEFLLNLLLNTAPNLQDGIPVGVPKHVKIAHKTGQLPAYSWEDAAIVYGDTTDYVLVVINRDITYDEARRKVQQISKYVYDTLN